MAAKPVSKAPPLLHVSTLFGGGDLVKEDAKPITKTSILNI